MSDFDQQMTKYKLRHSASPLCIFFLTFDENSREVRSDVLGDSQGVPGVNGPVGKNYSAGADVIGAVILVGLGHGLRQLLSTDIVEVCTLFHVIPRGEEKCRLTMQRLMKLEAKRDGGRCVMWK